MKFDRISILQLSGLFTKIKFKDGYHESRYLKIKAYLMYFISITALSRLPLGLVYPQNDSRQLFIGNLFNHLSSFTRLFLCISGILVISWFTFLFFFYFRYLNNNQEKLILMWLKMTDTVLINDDNLFRVVGISKKENKKFWHNHNNLDFILSRIFYVYYIFLCISFNLPLLFLRYEADLLIFILNLIVLIIHYSIYIYYVIKILFFYSVFFIEIIFFFYFKLDKLIDKLIKINNSKIKKLEFNLKLTKLIYQFDYFYFEIAKINTFFNKFIGFNYFHLVFIQIIFIFASLFGDTNLKIGMTVLIISEFFLIIYYPFYLSNKLKFKMHKVNFHLQNQSFKSITSYSNKRKINHINKILKFNDGHLLQCLNLFPLNSFNAFNTGIHIIINVLLLIRISNVLYN